MVYKPTRAEYAIRVDIKNSNEYFSKRTKLLEKMKAKLKDKRS